MKLSPLFALLLCSLAHAQTPSQPASPAFPITVSGSVRNVSIGLEGALKVEISQKDKMYTAKGQFSGLFGFFEVTGRALSNCAEGHTCLVFAGAMRLDQKNGGWPDGTMTTFVLTLDLLPKGNEVRGVYHIGPLEGLDAPQYGTLDAKIIR